MASMSIEFYNLLQAHEEGLPDSAVKDHFGDKYSGLANIINEMVDANRLQLFTIGDMLVYKLIHEETAMKFEGLGPEQKLVYQVIEKANNKGIWTRDIKTQTNIQQQILTKTLKILEQRNLIKSVRSVVSKSKKLYMLYELEPAKEVSGGPWYTDQEFDHEYLELLSEEIVQTVRAMGIADSNSIAEKIRIGGISKVELTKEELELLIQTLVYDCRLEEVRNAAIYAAAANTRMGSVLYKVAKVSTISNNFTTLPCGLCPMTQQCREGGIISPSTCEYMNEWLGSNSENAESGGW